MGYNLGASGGEYPPGVVNKIEHHSYVFPGFNNIERRSKLLASVLRWMLYKGEQGFFSRFGISHFMIVKKIK